MMRILVVLLVLVPGAAFAQERVVLETVTLQPQEKKSASIDATKKTRIGWDHVKEATSDTCKNNCVMMTPPGMAGYAQATGGSMRLDPIDGKITVILENVEAFPLEIVIYREELP